MSRFGFRKGQRLKPDFRPPRPPATPRLSSAQDRIRLGDELVVDGVRPGIRPEAIGEVVLNRRATLDAGVNPRRGCPLANPTYTCEVHFEPIAICEPNRIVQSIRVTRHAHARLGHRSEIVGTLEERLRREVPPTGFGSYCLAAWLMGRRSLSAPGRQRRPGHCGQWSVR